MIMFLFCQGKLNDLMVVFEAWVIINVSVFLIDNDYSWLCLENLPAIEWETPLLV